MTKTIRNLALAALPVAALAGVSAVSAQPADHQTKGEAELSKLLAGRIAGEPTECITPFRHDDFRVIDRTALVFTRGRTIYVNRPENAAALDSYVVPVVKSFGGGQLCAQDSVDLVHRGAPHTAEQTIFLSQFVPYTLPAAAR